MSKDNAETSLETNEDTSLELEAGGLKFKNPFIVASGPASKTVDQIVKAEKYGWAGVSIKLTFDPKPYISLNPRYRWLDKEDYHIFTAEKRLNVNEGLDLVKEARKKTKEIIIFANMTYSGDKGTVGWAELAKKFEGVGAHAIELNFCCPNMSFNLDEIGKIKKGRPLSGASLGSDPDVVSAIISAIKKAVKIPVFAKFTPEGGKIGAMAKAAMTAGVDGVAGTGNRLGIAPIEIDNLKKSIYRLQEGVSLGCISGPWLKPLALKDVFQMRKSVGPDFPVMGTGGMRNHRDCIEMTMVGADLIGICTEVMIRGFEILPKIIKNTKEYLKKMNKKKYSELRDLALPHFRAATEVVVINGIAEVDESKCNGCGLCARVGHCYAIEIKDKKAIIDKSKCLGCSTCVDMCNRDAIQMIKI